MRNRLISRRHGLGVVLAASLAASSGAVVAQTPADNEPSDLVVVQPVKSIDEAAAIEVARQYVATNSVVDLDVAPTDSDELVAQFAESTGDGPTVAVSAVVATDHNDTTSVYLQQTIDAIAVRGAVSTVTVGSAGDVLAANDSFSSSTDSFGASEAAPALSVLDAASMAADALNIVSTDDFEVLTAAGDAAQNHELTDAGVSRSNIPARLVYEPVDEKTNRLAWEFLIDSTVSNDWWRIRIDAETGAELSRFNLVVHEADPAGHADDHGADADGVAGGETGESFSGSTGSSFTDGGSSNPVTDGSSYRVFAAPAESPEHTTPADTRTLVANPADAGASPFGWHDTNGAVGADTTTTTGNNVDAGTDRDGDDELDLGSQPVNAELDFDFPFDGSMSPDGFVPAVVTNLFYWNNITHDFLYSYGFNEAAGNFQRNNYGKGGVGGDAVVAEAQDTAGLFGSSRETDNANFATPPDGMAPRMQMYFFSGSPERASSMDAGVITHEYAHGLSTRLTGGPAYDECLDNEEQQGEGWSDIVALLMTMKGTTPADRTRGIGTYVVGQPTTGIGIRGQRYATGGLAGNNWTYDSITSGTLSVHRVGSVWAQMLWEMTWALVDKHGFDADLANGSGGNNLATQLIVDGLKLQPCSPGFVDSRDAILQADAINNGGQNTCLIWEKFAERGLGVGADQGSSDDRLDGVEDFSVPASCGVSLGVAAPAEVGPGAALTYTLTASNGEAVPATGATISAPVPTGTTYVDGSATCSGTLSGSTVLMTAGTIAPGASTACTFAVTTSPSSFGARDLDDSFDNGMSNWRTRHAASAFSNDWELFTFSGGERAATADATDGISDQYLELAQPIAAQGDTTMSVVHWPNLEAGAAVGFDGGVIEASTNGGSTWSDLGSMMTRNGYNLSISSLFASPISGREAFSGNSGGLIKTDIDLSSFAGNNVLIRFRLSSDETEADSGFWLVRTVQVTNGEVRVETSPTLTLTSSPETYTGFASTRVSKEPAAPNRSDVVTPVTPVRLLDTRPTGETIDGAQSKQGKQSAGSSITLPVAGRSSVPSGAVGVVVNVTAIGPEGTGFFTVHPCLSPVPVASSLNYTTGVNLGNEIVAELDSSGNLCIFTSATTHIAADVVGYLSTSSAYGSVAPSRLLDTRDSGQLSAGGEASLQVGGRAGVPANAGAVIVNVTAIGPTQSGFITAHSCLSPRPLSSSLNYTAGLTRGNEIVAELDSSGKMCLYTSAATNLSVDIVGYLPSGSTISAVTPSRLLDTRSTGQTVDGESAAIGVRTAGDETIVRIGGRGGIPANASAVLMNITAIRPSGAGFVTVAPCGVARPNASSLNYVGGVNGGNDIIIGLGTDESICIFNSAGTELSVDVTGYAI